TGLRLRRVPRAAGSGAAAMAPARLVRPVRRWAAVSAPRVVLARPWARGLPAAGWAAVPVALAAWAAAGAMAAAAAGAADGPPPCTHEDAHAAPPSDPQRRMKGQLYFFRQGRGLLCTIDTVAGVAQAGDDVALLVQALVQGAQVDLDVGVGGAQGLDAFGRADQADEF